MELYDKLVKRQAEGNIIITGLVGCGQMGSGLVHVTKKMQGLETYAIADINVQLPIDALTSLGISRDDIVVTNVKSEAEDCLKKGKYLVTEDALLLPQLDNMDVIIEATGITEIGARVAWTGIVNDKNIVMLNVETDVTVGVLLDRLSRKGKGIYTVADGDEPAVCKMLNDFSKTMGFEVVCLGKGKNNTINYDITPEKCRDEAEHKGMNPKMLASFIDGTKTMVEMAAVSNATGLLPDIPGMHGPKIEIEDLNKVYIPKEDGGILSKSGCVDYSTGKIAPGVFAVVKSDDPRIIKDMGFLAMGDGPYYTFYRPYHLCNIETPIAAAVAMVYGERTVTAAEMHSEVVAIAKCDLKTGETVSGTGGPEFFNRIYTYKEAREKKAIPMGIAPGGKVIREIKKGEMFTEDNFAPDETKFVCKLRKMQDEMLGMTRG